MAAAPVSALRTADPPPNRGRFAFAQGRYGVRGNLELLLCDEDDGLWVLWFNSDPEDTEPEPGGPPPGEWSGALRFGTGRRYDGVHVVQSLHGPHHLEVLAHAASSPHRLRWSPEAAFTTEDAPPTGAVSSATIAETSDGTLWLAAVTEDGALKLLRADAAAYPRLSWSEATPPVSLAGHRWSDVVLLPVPGAVRPGVAVLASDRTVYAGPDGRCHVLPAARTVAVAAPGGEERLYLWTGGCALEVVRPGRPEEDRRLALPGSNEVTAVAATAIAYAGGRVDLVVRRDGRLWHLKDPGPAGEVSAAPLVSRLTRTASGPQAPVHRVS
ncbi:hypothetical protein AB0912_22100 [Streptomyces sp. NPDC007084]|uniref:hypothetical protein n=1 Tax=Streptomyces sp. NPDC007084 TaxID=3154313 RepID=UPI00345725DA